MKITWLGHACFMLEEAGYQLLIDPYEGVEGYKDVHTQAHAVYCSHGHHDHSYTAGVALLPAAESPFTVREVQTCHDSQGGALRGRNTVRIFTAGGVTVVHLGDLGHRLTAEQARAIGKCDVLLVPVGGFYTIGAEDAYAVAVQLRPRCVVPMHYRHGPHGLQDVDTVEPFLALYPASDVARPGPTLDTAESLPPVAVLSALGV